MINLKIDPEFQSQIPPLTDDEFKQLEENILKEGKLISPLIVWNNTLVDGHNRYAILQKHPEIYFSTMPLRFANREEALAWICKNQLGRRNLTPEQKKFLIGKQYSVEHRKPGGNGNNQHTAAAKKPLLGFAKISWGGAIFPPNKSVTCWGSSTNLKRKPRKSFTATSTL